MNKRPVVISIQEARDHAGQYIIKMNQRKGSFLRVQKDVWFKILTRNGECFGESLMLTDELEYEFNKFVNNLVEASKN